MRGCTSVILCHVHNMTVRAIIFSYALALHSIQGLIISHSLYHRKRGEPETSKAHNQPSHCDLGTFAYGHHNNPYCTFKACFTKMRGRWSSVQQQSFSVYLGNKLNHSDKRVVSE